MQIGPFQVERELGRGGMGAVYLARDPRDGAPVAVKVMLADFASDEDSLARFEREGRALERLVHPHVVRLRARGRWANGHWLAMDYVAGESLQDRLARQGPLSPDAARRLLLALCGALEHAHQAGILHRDLKPGNVLLRAPDDHPLVVDFGLALPLDVSQHLTRTGEILGSPGFLAPEQCGTGDPSGPATDVYGLGGVLYAALTGQPPFVGSTLLQLLDQVLHGAPSPPRTLAPAVTPALERICLRCLEKRPADRFASAHELAEALELSAAAPDRAAGSWRAWAVLTGALALGGAAGALALAPSLRSPGPAPSPDASSTPGLEPSTRPAQPLDPEALAAGLRAAREAGDREEWALAHAQLGERDDEAAVQLRYDLLRRERATTPGDDLGPRRAAALARAHALASRAPTALARALELLTAATFPLGASEWAAEIAAQSTPTLDELVGDPTLPRPLWCDLLGLQASRHLHDAESAEAPLLPAFEEAVEVWVQSGAPAWEARALLAAGSPTLRAPGDSVSRSLAAIAAAEPLLVQPLPAVARPWLHLARGRALVQARAPLRPCAIEFDSVLKDPGANAALRAQAALAWAEHAANESQREEVEAALARCELDALPPQSRDRARLLRIGLHLDAGYLAQAHAALEALADPQATRAQVLRRILAILEGRADLDALEGLRVSSAGEWRRALLGRACLGPRPDLLDPLSALSPRDLALTLAHLWKDLAAPTWAKAAWLRAPLEARLRADLPAICAKLLSRGRWQLALDLTLSLTPPEERLAAGARAWSALRRGCRDLGPAHPEWRERLRASQARLALGDAPAPEAALAVGLLDLLLPEPPKLPTLHAAALRQRARMEAARGRLPDEYHAALCLALQDALERRSDYAFDLRLALERALGGWRDAVGAELQPEQLPLYALVSLRAPSATDMASVLSHAWAKYPDDATVVEALVLGTQYLPLTTQSLGDGIDSTWVLSFHPAATAVERALLLGQASRTRAQGEHWAEARATLRAADAWVASSPQAATWLALIEAHQLRMQRDPRAAAERAGAALELTDPEDRSYPVLLALAAPLLPNPAIQDSRFRQACALARSQSAALACARLAETPRLRLYGLSRVLARPAGNELELRNLVEEICGLQLEPRVLQGALTEAFWLQEASGMGYELSRQWRALGKVAPPELRTYAHLAALRSTWAGLRIRVLDGHEDRLPLLRAELRDRQELLAGLDPGTRQLQTATATAWIAALPPEPTPELDEALAALWAAAPSDTKLADAMATWLDLALLELRHEARLPPAARLELRRRLRDALGAWHQRGSVPPAARLLLARLQVEAEDLAGARETLRRPCSVLESELPFVSAEAALRLARVEFLRGDLEGLTYALFAAWGGPLSPPARLEAALHVAELEQIRGELPLALQHLETTLSYAEVGSRAHIHRLWCELAVARAEQGDARGAEAALREADAALPPDDAPARAWQRWAREAVSWALTRAERPPAALLALLGEEVPREPRLRAARHLLRRGAAAEVRRRVAAWAERPVAEGLLRGFAR